MDSDTVYSIALLIQKYCLVSPSFTFKCLAFKMCMKVGVGGTDPAVGELLAASLCWSDLVSKEAIVSCLGQLMKIKSHLFFFLLIFFFPFDVSFSQECVRKSTCT